MGSVYVSMSRGFDASQLHQTLRRWQSAEGIAHRVKSFKRRKKDQDERFEVGGKDSMCCGVAVLRLPERIAYSVKSVRGFRKIQTR